MSGYPETTDAEMADDARHVATFEAAIRLLGARYVVTLDGRERWEHALVKARADFARSRRPSPPKVVLD